MNHKSGVFFFVWLLVCIFAMVELAPCSSAKQSESKRALLKRANKLFDKNQLNQALPLYQEYLKSSPGSGEARARVAWIIFQGRRIDNDAVEKALVEAEKAVALSPRSPLTHNVLGAIYFSKGRVPEAQKEFRTVLKLDPKRKCGGCGDISGLLGGGNKSSLKQTTSARAKKESGR